MKTSIGLSKALKREAGIGILFASPWIIGFLVFTLYPILSSLFYSFTNYNTFNSPRWIGMSNYITIFRNPDFYKALTNTLFYVVISVPLNLILGVLIGLLLAQKTFGVRLYRTIYYLPNVLSVVAVSFLWKLLFDPNGPINRIIEAFGFKTPPIWLADSAFVKPAIIIMGAWGVGATVIIFLAAIKGVPGVLYEAAVIDGAGPFTRFRVITLPAISPTIYFNLIMGIIGSFQSFLTAYIMVGGGPNKASYFYGQLVYEMAFRDNRMGYASALSWILLLIILAITVVAIKSSGKMVVYFDT
ncbi:MAG: carbohydrate ABC transporter permease [Saccharofermentanales bacterium]